MGTYTKDEQTLRITKMKIKNSVRRTYIPYCFYLELKTHSSFVSSGIYSELGTVFHIILQGNSSSLVFNIIDKRMKRKYEP